MPNLPLPQMVTRQQLAQQLNVSPRWLANEGRRHLPSYRVGRQVRYSVAEVQEWLESAKVEGEA